MIPDPLRTEVRYNVGDALPVVHDFVEGDVEEDVLGPKTDRQYTPLKYKYDRRVQCI